MCQVCWYTSGIPALGRLRQEDLEFKAILTTACFKKPKNTRYMLFIEQILLTYIMQISVINKNLSSIE
jgi:hypothetical protein